MNEKLPIGGQADANTKIEITPEMIKAGVEVLEHVLCDVNVPRKEDLARAVYSAMDCVYRTHSSAISRLS